MNLIQDVFSLLGYTGEVTEVSFLVASLFLLWVVSSIFGVLYSVFKR